MTEKEKEQKTVAPGTAEKPGAVDAQARPPDLLTLNHMERGITPEDSEEVKWNFINGARKHHLMLSGVVSGIENQDTPDPVMVVDYEGVRILIPSREMFIERWPQGKPVPDEFRIRMGRFLGATIDFILAGVDIPSHAAVASRREAMKQLQKRYYEGGLVKVGTRLTARVIGVGGNTVMVEAMGVDTVIKGGSLGWEWFNDVTSVFSTGDLVVARVMAMQRNEETGHYAVRLSIKAATENPDLPALRRLVIGSNYFGTVTGVYDQLIFVRLKVGANAKTKLFYSHEMPSKFDTVSFQVRSVSEKYGVAFGLITRIIRRYNNLR